jgi:hypothetical protein
MCLTYSFLKELESRIVTLPVQCCTCCTSFWTSLLALSIRALEAVGSHERRSAWLQAIGRERGVILASTGGCVGLRARPKCRSLFIAALTTSVVQDTRAMLRWFYVLAHLLIEAGAARRDARIRFLKRRSRSSAASWAATGSSQARTTVPGHWRLVRILTTMSRTRSAPSRRKRILADWKSCIQGGSPSLLGGRRAPGICVNSWFTWRRRIGVTGEPSASFGSCG